MVLAEAADYKTATWTEAVAFRSGLSVCVKSRGEGSLVGGGGSPASLNLPGGAGLCQALSRAEGRFPAIMERAAKADVWESEAWEINEGSAWDRFQASSCFSKVVFNAFSLCSWRGKLMEAGCAFISLPVLLSVTCLPLGSKASATFGSSPAHFTHPYSFPALYSTSSSRDQQCSTWPHYPPPPIGFERRELNIELTSSLIVAILLLGTWCYFFSSD